MISIIVPVYNEELAIHNVLQNIQKTMDGMECEIIVIDDGSTDKSLELVKASGILNLKILDHVENLGYGKSLLDGIREAKHECIAIIDGDGSYPADEIHNLYKYYPRYDMIVGARKGSEYRRGILKRPARVLFKSLVEYASGRKTLDINSGLRIFKKSVVMQYADSLCKGFSFTTTITLLFCLGDYYIKYIPVVYQKRHGLSKVRHFRDSLRASQIIVEAILYYNPIKLFLLIAMASAMFGVLLGICDSLIIHSELIMIIASICVGISPLIFCLGLVSKQMQMIYRAVKKIAN
jgi:glycosyltransferase involved in cell wall biosynthesis